MHPLVLFLCGVWTIAVYVLPTAIAFSRKKKHRWIIAVINILGGWLYGVPWLVSLVWALLGLQTDGSKGFKAWPVGLGLFVAPFLFGALFRRGMQDMGPHKGVAEANNCVPKCPGFKPSAQLRATKTGKANRNEITNI